MISPFVRDGLIRRVLSPGLGQEAALISRGEELGTLTQDTIEGLDVYELDPASQLSLDEEGEEKNRAFLTNLHAKVFVVERARLRISSLARPTQPRQRSMATSNFYAKSLGRSRSSACIRS